MIHTRAQKKGERKDLGSFSRPNALLRLKLEKVLVRFQSGIHRSAVKGSGIELKSFKPYEPSDPLQTIDAFVSARISEDPEIDPVSRVYYAEKEITTVVLLDIGDSMKIPPRKEEYANNLFWLFALSTFRYNDRLRIIPFAGTTVYDSFWIGNEGAAGQFFDSMQYTAGTTLHRVAWVTDVFSYFAHLSLRDAVVIMISDFCQWQEEKINMLKSLGLHENNIQPIMIALDEWHGFTPHGYGMTLRDTVTARTSVLDMRNRGDVAQYADRARRHLLRIKETVHSFGIPMIVTPLITDPLAIVFKTFVKMGWV